MSVDRACIEIACMYCKIVGELSTVVINHDKYYKLHRSFHCLECGYRDDLTQKVSYGRNKGS